MSEKSIDNKTRSLVYTALMTTLVLLGTIVLRIPIPMTQGYVHLGDSMIFLAVLIFGRKRGSVAAGLGSSLADILGGYPFWAPWTFIIKFSMAFVAGFIIEKSSSKRKQGTHNAYRIFAMAIGGLLMTLAYFIAETVMYGSAAAAALGIPWNIGQAAVGIALSLTLYRCRKFV